MRAFVLFLVLLNVVYWVVRHDREVDAMGARAPLAHPPASGERLVLLSELGRDRTAGQGASPAVSSALTGLRCHAIGPLLSREAAERISGHLEGAGAGHVRVTTEARPVPAGFWVHLPPFPSRGEAEAVVSDLRAMGFRDYFVVPVGDQRNAVSLGLFSSRARALDRQKELEGLGVEAQIETRMREEPVFHVEYSGDMDVEGILGQARQGDSVVRRMAVDCGEIGVNPR